MSRSRRAGRYATCIYCGIPTGGARTCYAHRDLEALESQLATNPPPPRNSEAGGELERRHGRRRE